MTVRVWSPHWVTAIVRGGWDALFGAVPSNVSWVIFQASPVTARMVWVPGASPTKLPNGPHTVMVMGRSASTSPSVPVTEVGKLVPSTLRVGPDPHGATKGVAAFDRGVPFVGN